MLATMKPLSAISPVMPFTTASCSGPGASAPRFHAIAVLPLMTLLPIQRSLAPLVDEADGQHAEEADHRQEAEPADVVQRHRPGKQERDLEIEDDEQDCHEIEPHGEPAARIIKRLEAAFVGGHLLRIRLLPRGQ